MGSVDNTYNLTFETSHGETWDQKPKTSEGKIAREQKIYHRTFFVADMISPTDGKTPSYNLLFVVYVEKPE